MAPKASKPKKNAGGYKMAPPIPKGEILEDVNKKKWRLGVSIGKGGFGEIYSAEEYNETKKSSKEDYVIKIEPHANGPLFVEMHFYMRNAKPNDVEAFQSLKKLQSFGMPKYLGSGSHEYRGEKFRFLVMEKFGSDIWKIYLQNGKCFPKASAFKLTLQILPILEYIHGRGYVHADIKGSNILLGATKKTQSQAYLVDFGLACHYTTGKNFTPDPKKAHDGTIEYLSRDAHHGVPTRRGDLEILGYNIIHWLGRKLPWEDSLTDPVKVKEKKEAAMKNVKSFLKNCFDVEKVPKAVEKYFEYVSSLNFDSEPDYVKIERILKDGLEEAGGNLKSPLSLVRTESERKRKSNVDEGSSPLKKTKGRKKIIKDEEEETENLKVEESVKAKKERKKDNKQGKGKVVSKEKIQSKENVEGVNEYNGYTAEMLRVTSKIKTEKSNKGKSKKKLEDKVTEENEVKKSKRGMPRVDYTEL